MVHLLHSLFTLPLGLYNDKLPIIRALKWEIPDTGFPKIVILSKLDFATDDSFLGGAADKFESHATGLTSTDLRHLDTNMYQVATEDNKGARTIKS